MQYLESVLNKLRTIITKLAVIINDATSSLVATKATVKLKAFLE